MSLISTTAPEHATGDVAQLYQRLQGTMDCLPNYAGIFSHRPNLMTHISALQEALKQHMDTRLYSLVTLAAAREINSSYCSLAFASKLISRYFSEKELIDILTEEAADVLSEKERAAMRIATRVARDSSRIEQVDIDKLHAVGFSDPEIFDLVAAAAWRCFFAKVPDSLGALADRALGELQPELLDLLLVGRDLHPETSPPAKLQQHSVESSQALQKMKLPLSNLDRRSGATAGPIA
jgi:alkylhydroperoxidase family enzyme